MSSQQSQPPITTLFLDVGGVLLTNGWDRHARRRACELFDLDWDEANERHHLTFDTYETGKLSLDAYLDRVVFYQQRHFSREEFKQFMWDQSKPYPDTIHFIRSLASRYCLRTGVISNEGRELAVHRTRTFHLADFIEVFVYSSFVHYRKPDEDIYRVALDVAQATPEQAVYIEDRAMFVDGATSLGMHGIHHTSLDSTRAALASLGLTLPEGVPA